MEKLTIAVFFGGRAAEHDVSIVTALQAMDALNPDAYTVVPVYITREGHFVTGNMLRDLSFYKAYEDRFVTRCILSAEPGDSELYAIDSPKFLIFGGGKRTIANIDCALLCFHGTYGEDGALQGLLELADIPYTSSGVLGSSVCMDKVVMKAALRGCGFPTLDYVWFNRQDWERDPDSIAARIEAEVGYPAFVKPANLGSSIGISKAVDRQSLTTAIEVATKYDQRIMVEKGLTKPTEINCAVLGWSDEAIASVCEQPLGWEEFLTFEDKYLRGGQDAPQGMKGQDRRIPAPIGREMTAEIQRISVDIFKALNLKGVVRIDYMIDDGGSLYVGEVNTIPGSLAFYLWDFGGLPFASLLDRMIECALLSQAERRKNVFSYDSSILTKLTSGAKSAKTGKMPGKMR